LQFYIDVPKINRSLIYDDIMLKTNSYSFSSHISKFKKYVNNISICNDRPLYKHMEIQIIVQIK